MTYQEIIDEIDAYNRRRESDTKDCLHTRAALDYHLAQLIVTAFNDPKKYPTTLQNAYPELFKEEARESSWQESKSQFKAYAEVFNRQRGGA